MKVLIRIFLILKKKIRNTSVLKKPCYHNIHFKKRLFFFNFFKNGIFLKITIFVFFLIVKFLFFKKLQKRFSYSLILKSFFKKTVYFFRIFYFKVKFFKTFFMRKMRAFFNQTLRKKRDYRLIWKKKRRFFKKYKKKLWIKFKRFFKLRKIKNYHNPLSNLNDINFLSFFDSFLLQSKNPYFFIFLIFKNKIYFNKQYHKYLKYYFWDETPNENFFDTILLMFFLKKKKSKRRILQKFKSFSYINVFLWDNLKLKYLFFRPLKFYIVTNYLRIVGSLNKSFISTYINQKFFVRTKQVEIFFKKKLNYRNFFFELKNYFKLKKRKVVRFNYYRFKKKRKSKKRFLRFFKKRKLINFVKKKRRRTKNFFKKFSLNIKNFNWFFNFYFNFSFKNYIFSLLYHSFAITTIKKKFFNWNSKFITFFKVVKQFFASKKFWPNTLLFNEVLTRNEYKYFYDQQKLIDTKKTLSPLLFFKQYIFGFLEKLLDKKVFFRIKLKNIRSKYILRRSLKLFIKYRRMRRAIGRGFFLGEFIDLLWYSFKKKDLTALMRWVSKSMKRIRIKKHKKFLSFFKFFLIKNKNFFLKFNKIKGFKFDIRGKVGVTGNAKKRHVMFSFGRLSFSKKRTRLDYQQGLVFTNTGVLGVTMLLFY